MRKALDRIVESYPAYEWIETTERVINIMPRHTPGRDALLGRVVPHFALQQAGLMDAVLAVHRVFDPGYEFGVTIGGLAGSSAAEIAELERKRDADYARPLTVSLKHASVREILNAIVVAHGRITWEVTYRRLPAEYPNCTLRFRGFDGWATASGARMSSGR